MRFKNFVADNSFCYPREVNIYLPAGAGFILLIAVLSRDFRREALLWWSRWVFAALSSIFWTVRSSFSAEAKFFSDTKVLTFLICDLRADLMGLLWARLLSDCLPLLIADLE